MVIYEVKFRVDFLISMFDAIHKCKSINRDEHRHENQYKFSLTYFIFSHTMDACWIRMRKKREIAKYSNRQTQKNYAFVLDEIYTAKVIFEMHQC